MTRLAPVKQGGKNRLFNNSFGEIGSFFWRKGKWAPYLASRQKNLSSVLPGKVATNHMWLFNFKLTNKMKQFGPLVALVTFHSLHCHM